MGSNRVISLKKPARLVYTLPLRTLASTSNRASMFQRDVGASRFPSMPSRIRRQKSSGELDSPANRQPTPTMAMGSRWGDDMIHCAVRCSAASLYATRPPQSERTVAELRNARRQRAVEELPEV